MAGMMDANTTNLFRTNVWERTLKSLLLDELYANKFVRTLNNFPDGFTINIPSLGEATQHDYTEGQAIKYDSLDTGNFTFSFDQYKYSAHSISEKFKRDSFYSQEVQGAFVPRQHRVIMEGYETVVLSKANSGQTASDLNAINGGAHRFVATGSQNSAVAMTMNDLARAQNSLFTANIPLRNLVGIIHPSVAYTWQTQTNMVNLMTPSPQWERIAHDGAVSGFKFMFNIFGFDMYISNYLPAVGSETINSVAVTNSVPNYFFSAIPGDTLPWVGAWRQMPTVYSEFNKDLQQTEFLTICEYGVKLYRPENLVTILTSTSVVA